MYFQRTVRREIDCAGVGLHSGRRITMTIKPGEADEGIIFYRKDVPEKNIVKADPLNVCDTTLATTLKSNGTKIATVEHLLSAFMGMGIVNAVVEIDSFELPIMDGSSLPFVKLLKEVGTVIQKEPRKFLLIKKPVSVSDGVGKAMLSPAPEFKITYQIDFGHPFIGYQSFSMDFSSETYEKEICAARTFGFLHEVEYLQAKGLALGGSLKNAIVLDDEKVINKEGLRYSDEFVRHKILDAFGDLYLLGMPIIGHFSAYKSGHKLNNLLLRKLLTHADSFELVEYHDGIPQAYEKYMDIKYESTMDIPVSL